MSMLSSLLIHMPVNVFQRNRFIVRFAKPLSPFKSSRRAYFSSLFFC